MSSKKNFENEFIKSFKSLFDGKKFSLHDPFFYGDEKDFLAKCIDSTYVSSFGKYVEEFENKVKDFTGSKYAIAVTNGTCGLHLGLYCSGVNFGDEIFVPSLTFVATVNSIIHANAIPHFIDYDQNSLDIDYSKLEQHIEDQCYFDGKSLFNKITKNKIYGLLVIHPFGHPMNMQMASKFSKKYNLQLFEDAAESLGSFFSNKHTGNFGKFGVLSFNGNKIITTGGGGMVITNNTTLANKIRHISKTSKINHPWKFEHDALGYNYRLPNLNASLGLSQLKHIKKIINFKRMLYKIYFKNFQKFDEFCLISEPENCKSNYWLQTIKLKNNSFSKFNKFINFANEHNVQMRPVWSPAHKFKYLRKFPKMNLDNTVKLERSLINIPSGYDLRSRLR